MPYNHTLYTITSPRPSSKYYLLLLPPHAFLAAQSRQSYVDSLVVLPQTDVLGVAVDGKVHLPETDPGAVVEGILEAEDAKQ
jgi:hypothetical protein